MPDKPEHKTLLPQVEFSEEFVKTKVQKSWEDISISTEKWSLLTGVSSGHVLSYLLKEFL